MRALVKSVLVATALASTAAQANVITVTGTFSAADPTVSPRPARVMPAATCMAPKGFAGALTGTSGYESYSFFNNGPAECITVTQLAGDNLFVIAYGAGGFDPSSLGSNYLGDGGSSSVGTSYSVNVAADSAFTLVAFDVFNGDANYSFSVAGDNLSTGVATVVPEPESMALLVIGMLAAVSTVRRRVRAPA